MSERNQNKELYQFGPFRVNVGERVLTKGQAAVPLTPKAFDTFVVLVRNSGRIVEKEDFSKRCGQTLLSRKVFWPSMLRPFGRH